MTVHGGKGQPLLLNPFCPAGWNEDLGAVLCSKLCCAQLPGLAAVVIERGGSGVAPALEEVKASQDSTQAIQIGRAHV